MPSTRYAPHRAKSALPSTSHSVVKALKKLEEEQWREQQHLARAMRAMKRPYVICPGCLEHLPRVSATILHHTRSGCGEILSLRKLWSVIKRERQASPQGPNFISADSLLAEIERLAGKPGWAIEAAIDELTLDMEDIALTGASGSGN